MRKFKIFQLHLTNAERDVVNAVGWDTAGKAIPKVKAYLDTRFSASTLKAREAWTNGFYDHVADIEATDLEDCFEIGNIGPEKKITRHDRMSSISVGDLILEGDTLSIVADFGFEVVA